MGLKFKTPPSPSCNLKKSFAMETKLMYCLFIIYYQLVFVLFMHILGQAVSEVISENR